VVAAIPADSSPDVFKNVLRENLAVTMSSPLQRYRYQALVFHVRTTDMLLYACIDIF